MIFTKQSEVEAAISTTYRILVVLENKLEETRLSDDKHNREVSVNNRNAVQRRLKEERKE